MSGVACSRERWLGVSHSRLHHTCVLAPFPGVKLLGEDSMNNWEVLRTASNNLRKEEGAPCFSF